MSRRPRLEPFTDILHARFVARPNRFRVCCALMDGTTVDAFLPNPGRMWELLWPGVILYLVKRPEDRPERKTAYTVVAVEREGHPVFLHTHVTNDVAEYLIESDRIPALHGARIAQREVAVGRSRFDFVVEQDGCAIYLEVKSCTLFGNGVAMFPDAVTDRGRRHLLHLAEMARDGLPTAVLFVIHYPHVDWFMPDYHTDPAFAAALLEVRDTVQVLAAAVEWRSDLTLGPTVKTPAIPWDYIAQECVDRGAYLLDLELAEGTTVAVGELGPIHFERGHYIYVGSAMGGLAARMARHTRKRKKLRWHVDYLRQAATDCTALPIRSSKRIECALAQALTDAGFALGPKRFGSSDCACPGHLFYSPEPPLHRTAIHTVLQQFRMAPPDVSR